MKKFSLIIITLMIVLSGCAKTEENKKKNNEENAKELVENLIYIKDEKTNLCFAYTWHDEMLVGAPAFTEIDCYKVEKFLVK